MQTEAIQAISPQWANVAITVLVVLGGTAVNLFLIGRFVGSFGEAMKNLGSLLSSIEGRVAEVEEKSSISERSQVDFNVRLNHVEKTSAVVAEFRDEFIAMKATFTSESRHSVEKLDSVIRSVHGIERQFANLMSGRGDRLVEIRDTRPGEG